MELLTLMQNSILSLVSNRGIEGNAQHRHMLNRVLNKQIPAQENFKVLIPSLAEESLSPLLELNPSLELVCLRDKGRDKKKQIIPRAEDRRRISFVNQDLRTFRAQADFDLVFYSMLHVAEQTDSLSEEFCHCRMLLKPGGSLFFHVQKSHSKSFLPAPNEQKKISREILTRAGLHNIIEHRSSNGDILYSGQRPFFHF